MDEADEAVPPPGEEDAPEPSLEQLADDLAGVERALERLEDGSYWTDEATGDPLPDDALAADPTTRRAPAPPADPPSG